jgi:hypothetical protein
MSKQERREAAEREMARRNRQAETGRGSGAGRESGAGADAANRFNWGTASGLPAATRNNLARIGAVPQAPTQSNAVDILVDEIAWPRTVFQLSIDLLRQLMVDQGDTFVAEMDDLELRDESPFRADGLAFKRANQNLAAGMQTIDPEAFVADSFFLYLLPKQSRSNDPTVFVVDLEDGVNEPRNSGETIGALLAVLE